MKMQKLDPRIVSITQIRRDIDVLNKILEKEDEAVVMKNQSLMFIALTPQRYRQFQRNEQSEDKLSFRKVASERIDFLRNKYGQPKKGKMSGCDYVMKLRDERVLKWKK